MTSLNFEELAEPEEESEAPAVGRSSTYDVCLGHTIAVGQHTDQLVPFWGWKTPPYRFILAVCKHLQAQDKCSCGVLKQRNPSSCVCRPLSNCCRRCRRVEKTTKRRRKRPRRPAGRPDSFGRRSAWQRNQAGAEVLRFGKAGNCES